MKRCKKIKHTSKRSAYKHALVLWFKKGDRLCRPYKCRCGYWHIGGKVKRHELLSIVDTTFQEYAHEQPV